VSFGGCGVYCGVWLLWTDPCLAILIQPKQHGQRFRYLCESKSAGSLVGEGSTNEHKLYPTIEVYLPFRILNVLLIVWTLAYIHTSIFGPSLLFSGLHLCIPCEDMNYY